MNVERSDLAGAVVLKVQGDIDSSTAPDLQGHVLGASTPGSTLLLDLSGVEFMSSAGLRVLLLLHRRIAGGTGRVVLVGLRDQLRGVMEATGFLKFFSTVESVEQGLADR